MNPSWSPSGERILFSHFPGRTGPSQLATIRADGGDLRVLATRPQESYWSPDGSKVAFRRGDSSQILMLVNADGSDERQVAFLPSLVAGSR